MYLASLPSTISSQDIIVTSLRAGIKRRVKAADAPAAAARATSSSLVRLLARGVALGVSRGVSRGVSLGSLYPEAQESQKRTHHSHLAQILVNSCNMRTNICIIKLAYEHQERYEVQRLNILHRWRQLRTNLECSCASLRNFTGAGPLGPPFLMPA